MKFEFDATPEEISEAYRDKNIQAQARLYELGFKLRNDPTVDRPRDSSGHFYSGEVPPNAETLTNTELSELLSLHAIWTKYINTQLAEAEAEVKNHKKWLDALEASLIKTGGKDASVENDKRYIEINSEYMFWETMKIYLERFRDDASVDYRTLSRIATIRGMDQDANTRINVMANNRQPFSGKYR